MKQRILAAGIAALVMISNAGFAQTAAEPEATAAEPQEQTTISENAAENATSEAFQDWIVRCADVGAGQICEMLQEHSDRNSGSRILAIGLRRLEGDAAQLTIVAPLGLKLSEGVMLRGTEDYGLDLPFETCLPAGCIVSQQMPAGDVSTLLTQTELTVLMTTTEMQELAVNLSTEGMQAAWDRLAGM